MAKLITTDTYFGTFQIMCDLLKDRVNNLNDKNIIFCDEKATLMAERMICDRYGGSLNTKVYSFGNFLHVKKTINNLLSKEGSAMAVKKILSNSVLNCLKASRTSIAPSLLEVIYQIKSANVSPQDLSSVLDGIDGVLRGKLEDIASVYQEYEIFLKQKGLLDQYSAFSTLPEVIEESPEMADSHVFLVGFASFTSQVKLIIEKLIKKAKSVTAILVCGANTFVYVNEVANSFMQICQRVNEICIREDIPSQLTLEGKAISQKLFNPLLKSTKLNAENIYKHYAVDLASEVLAVASAIKEGVKNGLKYKDMSIACGNIDLYREEIRSVFGMMDIPFFLDEQKKPDNHPLVCLILAYIDIFKKGAGKKEIANLIKNPLWGKDKAFTDGFEKYIKTNNVCYANFFKPLTLPTKTENLIEEYEQFRLRVSSALSEHFNVKKFITTLGVEKVLKEYDTILENLNEAEEKAINSQIYNSIIDILNQIEGLLGDVKLDYHEYKSIFLSGVCALKLSIIPQYNDAVFIGDYKQISLAKARNLFAIGLTNEIPIAREDVSILSDDDIDSLTNLKVLIEPKIKLVNSRQRENLAMAICSFSDNLFISYPISNGTGGKNLRSEVLDFFERNFTLKEFSISHGYYTYKQGLISLAKACSNFADGFENDFSFPNAFYSLAEKEQVDKLKSKTNNQIKTKLVSNKEVMINKIVSPTSLEDYYKCPYMAFLSHALKIRQEDDGSVDVLSVGNLMHELFEKYLSNIEKVTDQDSSNKLFDEISKQALNDPRYARFLSDLSQKSMVDRVLRECRIFCYKNFNWLNSSDFKSSTTNLEVEINDVRKDKEKGYDAIKLLNGEVKLTGKIDRVDIFDDYFRIIDYKTGSADASEEKLFAGVKLQLYLYALAIKGKKLAGAYYMPINDSFKSQDKKDSQTLLIGKTLDDVNVIKSQDTDLKSNSKSKYLPVEIEGNKHKGTTEESKLASFLTYAFLLSEKAVLGMKDGVIAPSPFGDAQKSTCDYCAYKGMCDSAEAVCRKVGIVKEDTIYSAVSHEHGGLDE